MSALTAPFDTAWASRLGGALTVLTSVSVTASGMDPITLDVVNGTLTWDEDTTPHVEASLTCHVPDDVAVLDALDPRLNRRLVVTAGYRVPGVSESHVIADLMLTDRVVTRAAGVAKMTIRGVSDERRVIDTRPITGSRSFSNASDGGQAIRTLILWAAESWSALPAVEVTASGTFVASGDSLLINRDDDLWGSIQDIADRIGAWVYHDGLGADGAFHVVPQPTRAGPAAAMLKVGAGGTITASEAALTREAFANTVSVQYEWYDGQQQSVFGYAEVTSGPYAVAAIGRKQVRITIPRKGSAAQARAAAAQMVRRAVSRGRQVSVEVDHAPLWVRPGDTVTVELVTGRQVRHLVSRVDIDIPSGHGHITTRQPEDVVIETGE